MTKDKGRTYAIIGTGAVGGFYGARLQRAGIEVHFLLNRDWPQVREHGLVVESCEGNFTLPEVNAWRHTHDMPPCDVVIVALKTTQNHLLPELLPPVVKPNGVILLLQNGLGAEPEAGKIFDAQTVMGGLSFICSNKIGPGHIRHIDYGAITLGEYAPDYQSAGITATMEAIKSDFEAAKIPIFLEEDLLLARWKKLVWNIPYNGLSVVLDARTDEIMASPHTRQLAASLMQEVAAGAAACGRVVSDSFIQKMLEHTEKMKPYLTSMKLDFDRAHPLEVEAIFGYPLRMATSLGADLPLISMLYHQLKFIDDRLSGG
ncbi:MAG TPA: putative 2-dehydropantoate 2-reductase [Oscillatoriaceae cyanobacterium M33_DOE_052]|uniref:2-dehydropantoate 2-reductase n=1 Tax=Planktothricoides sp. SpSt-374 TaxID=2282167 RepID=A0A7C3VK89_9CYAN|nr:putative 2-dehydropantoate 2-reductase [Oscillatoriaceae cyanobacterium M33_DOE_052]